MGVLLQPPSLQEMILRVSLRHTLDLLRTWRMPCCWIHHYLIQSRRSGGNRRRSLQVSPLCPFVQVRIFSVCSAFYPKFFSIGPQNQEDPVGKIGAAACGGVTCGGGRGILLLQEMHKRIKLARENMSLVQKLLAVSNRVIEYVIFVDRVVRY